MRTICNPLTEADEGDVETTVTLELTGIRDDQDVRDRHAYLTMEAIAPASTGRYFVGVTALALTAIDDRDTSTPSARNALLDELAHSVLHPMWDYIQVHLRLLVSGLIDPTVDAPGQTPSPLIIREAEDEGDESGMDDD